ncbi:MAG: ABC transporter ATP-binding protein/permease [Clostridium sp.]|nr:ABC transporter ATP-binding protein/permease [Acetatifactor muris]MCM1526282.1 ABC transporter ATP-binding protein/permease [Bacteroides sp.]MCM1562901.1 ABC transporter ATP-binding protein/permease [Clostridium sp.]
MEKKSKLERLKFYIGRIKAGRLREMWRQTRWIYRYAGHYRGAMVFYTLLGMTGTAMSLLTSVVSKNLVDIITGNETGALARTFCLMIGLNVGSSLVSMVSDYAASRISMKVDAEIKADIFEKILVTDWESLTNYHTGDLLTRWSSDATNISSGVLSFVPNLVICLFRFISAFAVVICYDASFAVFAFLGMPVSLILSRTLMNRMVDQNQKSAALGAKMSGFNQEAFSNVQIIKAFDLVKLYIARLRQLQKEYITMRLDFKRISMGTSLLLGTVGLLVSYASYGWGIYRVWSGAITYGTMTMFLSLSGTLTGTLHNLTALVPTAIGLTTSAGRLMDIVEMPREDYGLEEETARFRERYRSEGISLYMRDITYAYRNGNRVFEHASLEAHPHEVIALVGPSGEGKTTMMRLILALIGLEAGSALLCGGNVPPDKAEIVLPLTASSRKLFSYVPQGNTLFSGTIEENMRNVKPDATEEEMIEALKLACAWEFVERLPEGLHSPVKERGGGFSEGQAQRLSIARAILRQSPLLLLDEATSALDVATERRVLKNIMEAGYPRTCIVTTHRPTVLGICSRVYGIRDRRCELLSDEEIEEQMRGF